MGRNTSYAPWGEGISEESQADYLVRMYVLAMVEGVERVFTYTVQDSGTDSTDTEQHYGVLRVDSSPKAAFFAVKTLTAKLEGLSYRGSVLAEDRRARGYLFEHEERSIIVLWAVEGETGILLPTGSEKVTVTTREGRREEVGTPDGYLKLTLTESPVYLEGFDARWTRLMAAFSVAVPWLQARQGQDYTLPCRITNPTTESFRWRLYVQGPDRTQLKTVPSEGRLASGENQVVEVQVSIPASIKPGAILKVDLSLHLRSDREDLPTTHKTVQVPVQLDWLTCGTFPNPLHSKQVAWGESVPDSGLYVDYLKDRGGEEQIEPEVGWVHHSEEVEGKRVRWTRYQLDQRGFVDMRHTLFPNKHVVGYAFCRIFSDREGWATLNVGSDDGMRIWLNHKLVFQRHIHRGAHVNQERVIVKLKKGANPCLVKVDQGSWGWGFYLFVDPPLIAR
jgi:hypothetical protein